MAVTRNWKIDYGVKSRSFELRYKYKIMRCHIFQSNNNYCSFTISLYGYINKFNTCSSFICFQHQDNMCV